MSNEETIVRRLLGPVRKLLKHFMLSLTSSERLNHFFTWKASVEEDKQQKILFFHAFSVLHIKGDIRGTPTSGV